MSRSLRVASVLAVSTLLLLVAAPAFAHVTVRAEDPAPGAFAKYTIRVPNERDDAATTMVEVEIPEGLEVTSYQPKDGWDIEVGDGVIAISGGAIEPGQFDEFVFVGRNPETPTELVFPSVQTYEGGEEVNWIGTPDSDEPAPVVEIVGTAAGHGASEAGEEGSENTEPPNTATTNDETDGDAEEGTSALTWVAAVLGAIGVVLGGTALARSGKSASRA